MVTNGSWCLFKLTCLQQSWDGEANPPETRVCTFLHAWAHGWMCVTPRSNAAYVFVRDTVWRARESVFGWGDLQLNWWPAKDQMRGSFSGSTESQVEVQTKREAVTFCQWLSNSTSIMSRDEYILVMHCVCTVFSAQAQDLTLQLCSLLQ